MNDIDEINLADVPDGTMILYTTEYSHGERYLGNTCHGYKRRVHTSVFIWGQTETIKIGHFVPVHEWTIFDPSKQEWFDSKEVLPEAGRLVVISMYKGFDHNFYNIAKIPEPIFHKYGEGKFLVYLPFYPINEEHLETNHDYFPNIDVHMDAPYWCYLEDVK